MIYRSIAILVLTALAPGLASAQADACAGGATSRGNPVTGRTLTLVREMPSVTPAEAFGALKSALESSSADQLPPATFQTADAERGVLMGQQTPRGAARPVALQVAIVGLPGGATQVTVSNRFPAGMVLAQSARSWAQPYCDLLAALAGGAPAGGTPAGGTPVQPSARTVGRVPAFLRGCTPQAHQLGTTATGELSVSDCKTEGLDRVPTDVYQVTTTTQRDLMISFETPGRFGELLLLTPDGQRIAEENAPGGYATLRTQVAPGTYFLAIRQSAINITPPYTGRYTLTSSTDQVGFAGCISSFPVLPVVGRVQGTWSVSDCQFHERGATFYYADYYLLKVDRTREVTLSASSPGNAARIVFIAQRDGTMLTDASYGSGAAVTQVLEPGEYIVGVAAGRDSERMTTGPYTLSIR